MIRIDNATYGESLISTPSREMALMTAAAREFGVPVRVLLAISYNETRLSLIHI